MNGNTGKIQVRKDLRRVRRALSFADRQQQHDAITGHLLPWLARRGWPDTAAYIACGGECSLEEVLKRYWKDSRPIWLPRMRASHEVVWHACRNADDLQSGPHGIPEPNPSQSPSLPTLPEGLIVLVPGIGFTLDGKRLGQGAGCYDRILGRRDLVSIGVAFTCQIVVDLPTEAHDQSLHFLVCPDGLHSTQKTAALLV